MIVLFTDFGSRDPYVGQMKGKLFAEAPGVPVVDLLHEAPDFNAHAGAHLLVALAQAFPTGSVFVAVVDPGVGTPREAVVVRAAGRCFVGPDNGLLSVLAARSGDAEAWRIVWRPAALSATFHGRDLFAPVAAAIARGDWPADKLESTPRLTVEFDAGDLARVIYLDHYGNAWTGVRAEGVPRAARIVVGRSEFGRADTFAEVGKGEGFWFANSAGLIELALNRGSAAGKWGLKVGDAVQVHRPN